jgi:hypothetical protein
VLPVDTLDLPTATIDAVVDHAGVRALHAAIAQRVVAASSTALALVVGRQAARLAPHVLPAALRRVPMRAWGQAGALADWQQALASIKTIPYTKDVASPSFQYGGARGQIPRIDLPYGTLRWQGTSGDRAVRARAGTRPSADYFKVCMPQWAFDLSPEPLSAAEQAAANKAPK